MVGRWCWWANYLLSNLGTIRVTSEQIIGTIRAINSFIWLYENFNSCTFEFIFSLLIKCNHESYICVRF
ncbi:hypothetical protein HanIR_Chr09g0437971 [Helianthus annuus]|nr:hypothetical protein HanIR_Chr09g0437971 [Helianthus annuus]